MLLNTSALLKRWPRLIKSVLVISSQREWGCIGTAAQGGVGVTIHGGVQEQWRCGTEGPGQWAWGVWVGAGDLRGLSNLNGSVVLQMNFVSFLGVSIFLKIKVICNKHFEVSRAIILSLTCLAASSCRLSLTQFVVVQISNAAV